MSKKTECVSFVMFTQLDGCDMIEKHCLGQARKPKATLADQTKEKTI